MIEGASDLKVNSVGKLEVHVSDQTSPTIMLPMAQELAMTSLASDVAVNSYTMVVTSAAGFIVGQHIRIINAAADRYYFGTILGIAGTTITVDTQMDFLYVSGSEVTTSNINMNVDGSGTPVIFTLRTGAPSIPSSVDITKIILVCEAATAVDLNKFGDLAALTRGLAFRRTNGIQVNIFNLKTNKDLAGLAYDWTPYEASNPSQGINGFVAQIVFAGTSEMGVALRVEQDGNLEMLVQDDLTGLVALNVILEGHVVQD